MRFIAFSKDRAMQLDAFLRSFRQNVYPSPHAHILYLASDARHERAYLEVFKRHLPFMTAYRQQSFKRDVLELLPESGAVTFFVDDQIFIRRWAVTENPSLSLRLARHLTSDYATGTLSQPLPEFRMCTDGRLSWKWSEGVASWGYPLSVDGHVFDGAEMRAFLELIDFSSPNTMESGLQAFLPKFANRHGTCYLESRVVNVPWNRVQTDWVNRSMDAATPDELLAAWESGHQIDISALQGIHNESVHQEFPLVLEKRC